MVISELKRVALAHYRNNWRWIVPLTGLIALGDYVLGHFAWYGVVLFLLYGPLMAGLEWMYLTVTEGKGVTPKDIFKPFHYYWKVYQSSNGSNIRKRESI